eukprot:SAG22_NODE_4839_length_1154_cov_1.330806_2_plen_34_part_01
MSGQTPNSGWQTCLFGTEGPPPSSMVETTDNWST